MKLTPFAEYHVESWVFWPSLVGTLGTCECCGEIGGVRFTLSFLCFSLGLEFTRHEQ